MVKSNGTEMFMKQTSIILHNGGGHASALAATAQANNAPALHNRVGVEANLPGPVDMISFDLHVCHRDQNAKKTNVENQMDSDDTNDLPGKHSSDNARNATLAPHCSLLHTKINKNGSNLQALC